ERVRAQRLSARRLEHQRRPALAALTKMLDATPVVEVSPALQAPLNDPHGARGQRNLAYLLILRPRPDELLTRHVHVIDRQPTPIEIDLRHVNAGQLPRPQTGPEH